MSRAAAALFRYFPFPAAAGDEKSAPVAPVLAAKPRFSGAFVISLAIHTMPVLALAIAPALVEENPADKPVVLYSVQLEKKHTVITPNATVRKNAAQSSAKRSGNAEIDLTGEQRALKVSYEMQLAAKIERQRYYPQRARQLGQEGQPVVRMVLDAAGNVMQLALEISSGVSLLDETALDIVRRAQPFPAPPAEYAQILRHRGDNRMVFRAPISFGISRQGR